MGLPSAARSTTIISYETKSVCRVIHHPAILQGNGSWRNYRRPQQGMQDQTRYVAKRSIWITWVIQVCHGLMPQNAEDPRYPSRNGWKELTEKWLLVAKLALRVIGCVNKVEQNKYIRIKYISNCRTRAAQYNISNKILIWSDRKKKTCEIRTSTMFLSILRV